MQRLGSHVTRARSPVQLQCSVWGIRRKYAEESDSRVPFSASGSLAPRLARAAPLPVPDTRLSRPCCLGGSQAPRHPRGSGQRTKGKCPLRDRDAVGRRGRLAATCARSAPGCGQRRGSAGNSSGEAQSSAQVLRHPGACAGDCEPPPPEGVRSTLRQ